MMQFAVGGAVLPFIAFHLIDEGFSFRHIGEIFFFGSFLTILAKKNENWTTEVPDGIFLYNFVVNSCLMQEMWNTKNKDV